MCSDVDGSFLLQYKVKDIAEADFGRLEIDLAEAEMPGEWNQAAEAVKEAIVLGRAAPRWPDDQQCASPP
jgi:hypothetical protein